MRVKTISKEFVFLEYFSTLRKYISFLIVILKIFFSWLHVMFKSAVKFCLCRFTQQTVSKKILACIMVKYNLPKIHGIFSVWGCVKI